MYARVHFRIQYNILYIHCTATLCSCTCTCCLLLSAIEDAEDDDGVAAKTRKPWGDTSFYCPVALKNQEVLWPGNLDISARYKDRLYAFSTDEAKEKFTEDPSLYVAEGIPLQVRNTCTVRKCPTINPLQQIIYCTCTCTVSGYLIFANCPKYTRTCTCTCRCELNHIFF